MKNSIILLVAILSITVANAQKLDSSKDYLVSCIGFYNVENLFDTLNTNADSDKEFSPEGDRNWNTGLYYNKLENLARVIKQVGSEVSVDGLAIVGLAEIETKSVLNDLVKEEQLVNRDYKVVHYEGHDHRGIDVALLYQEKYFKLLSSKSIELVFEDTSYHSRDQLLVTGELMGERMHIIVAHWPSRSGGQKKSEPRRLEAAQLGRSIVDSILTSEPEAKIIYMGDLNDDPENKSLTKKMHAVGDRSNVGEGELYNPMKALSRKGIGSLAWRDSWNLFDQILMTPDFIDDNFNSWTVYRTKVYNKPFLKTKEGKYKGYPYRSYSGGAWTGGYSDHFPVYTILAKVKS